jgi:ferredoxin-NADP reductase
VPPVDKFLPVYEPDKHLLCLAGGSDITPFKAFAREAHLRKLETRTTVLYSVRITRDIIFREDFERLAQENPRFRFWVTCTRLEADDPWPGRRGRIDAAWIKEHATDPANTVFYTCGSQGMVDFVEQTVVHDLGVPKAQMRTEKWW